MDSGERFSAGAVGNIIGWCILAAAITPLTVVFFAVRGLGATSAMGGSLLILFVPTILMMALAGVGLIMRKPFGYWCAYLATFFGGIGGLKTPFVPFIQRFVNLGPATGHFFLVLNLIMIAILAWEHWTLIEAEGGERRKARRLGLLSILFAGAVSVTVGLTVESIHKREVSAPEELPAVGPYFAQLETTKSNLVRCVIVHNKLFHSVDGVITGTASEDAVKKFAEYHGLIQVEKPEVYGRILSKTRRWKLNEKGYPSDFSPPDLAFIGRPRNGDKALMQIAWRKSDSKFTAEMMGSVSEQSVAPDLNPR
jgi:hypothetical protein